MGQDDGSSSPVPISYKVNLTGNSFSHKYNVSCDFKTVCGQMLYCLSPTLFFVCFLFDFSVCLFVYFPPSFK